MLALMMFDLHLDGTRVLFDILTFVIATAIIFLSIWIKKPRSDPNWFEVWDEEDSDDDNWGPWTGN